MCGIAGILQFNAAPLRTQQLEFLLQQIAHRGQDQSGMAVGFADSGDANHIPTNISVGLGHRRLAIIDLNPQAAQPMFFADRQLCITYNGEIYNYKSLRKFFLKKNYPLVTQSDTEIILAAYHYWGKECVKHLNGMFAFAIWDNKKSELFCARDQLGIKPFYFYRDNQQFIFASESSAIARLIHADIDPTALQTYFLCMYTATHQSMFANITKLPPAHTLTINANGQYTLEQYWQLAICNQQTSSTETLASLENTLKKAIKRQLQSDVPVGGFLSGGIDSGLITAIAAKMTPRYHTYSIGYEGMRQNELPIANAIAKRYATRHTAITLTANDAIHNLDLALGSISEPVADPALAATFLLSKIAASDGVKVLLNGTGGDEIFAGYDRYHGFQSHYRKLLLALPTWLKKNLSHFLVDSSLKYRLQEPHLDMLFSTGGARGLAKKLRGKSEWQQLLQMLANFPLLQKTQSLPLLYQHMISDLSHYLPNQLLFLLDQMTMAHTVEGRVPLLDVKLVEQAFLFKADAHKTNQQSKALLKTLALPYLGHDIISKPKQGFAGSPVWWINQHLAHFIERIATLKEHALFSNLNIDHLIKQTQVKDCSNDIYHLYCFASWQHHTKEYYVD